MSMVHFKKELSTQALQLIEAKGSFEKIKAYNDIQQIKTFFNAYINGYWYDSISAKKLDKRLREDYPVIDSINNLSGFTTSTQSESNLPSIDPDISRLIQDYWGIQLDVLLKDCVVKKLEDFVDYVD